MSVGMPSLVDHVIALTQHRDRDLLDSALIEALMDLLLPQQVALVGVVSEAGQRYWLPLIRRERGGDLQVLSDPMWVQVQHLQRLEEDPCRQRCLASLQLLEVLPSPDSDSYLTVIPLFKDLREQGQGVIEIRSDSRLSPAALNILGRLLSVYRNMQGMLDYSECDALTGLLNRKSFDDAFFKVLRDDSLEPKESDVLAGQPERRHAAAATYWLAMLDIDHFKQVNDVHGHSIGDEVLLLVARLLKNTLRSLDRVFRFGGEEFVVLLRCPDESGATSALERVRRNMENFRFPQVGRITVSVGLTAVRPGDSPGVACERADQAVYFAKEHGRNQVRIYEQLITQGLLQTEDKVGVIELF
jgi:diguanylate cyclase (GGDEF)-like protein